MTATPDRLALLGGEPLRAAPWPKWPVVGAEEERLLLETLRSGNWWNRAFGHSLDHQQNADGPESRVIEFQNRFAAYQDCAYGVCTSNGTVSLEIALRAAGVRPGDEVIVPPYTYFATASAVLTVGAVPVFADIDPDTYNLDPAQIEPLISEYTAAIIPVHFGGQPCRMDEINALAKKYNLAVIEDAAHAHGALYKGRKCGSLGHIGSFSFQFSKNMTAGEGGILTTNAAGLAEHCERLVWAGRKAGEPWYVHYELASNARITEFQAAVLLGQLARVEEQCRLRAANAAHLTELLAQVEGIAPLRLEAETTRSAYHLYIFRYAPAAFGGLARERFVQALLAEGITGASSGYNHPLYANPLFASQPFGGGQCPNAERACAAEAVWLPQNLLLAGAEDMRDIQQALLKIQRLAHTLR
jgi:dTDP-4-amino-4,6-dideoxygalactose transaminase